ncbi:MAG: hypothetical protein PHP13_06800 [Methanomicrobium sp.]|nr:hypothetical protein [Methanomicrobium sp.]MDD4299391.1 hypothetical protein [Methanomicrobium sp.]
MKAKAGVACDCEGFFNRYINDCSICSEPVTPHMLAAPYFKGNFTALIIPTGFGNKLYSGLLPALRASSQRIEKFVKKGGRVLLFGAMTADPGCYDWLPFSCEYVHEYFSAPVQECENNPFSGFLDDFDAEKTEFDGYFIDTGESEVVCKTTDNKPVMIAKKYGSGYYIITSVHELPSKSFIKNFCSGDAEILF